MDAQRPSSPWVRSLKTGSNSLCSSSEQPMICCLLHAGDKPELLYPEAQAELHQMGYETTLQYLEVHSHTAHCDFLLHARSQHSALQAAAAAVMAETGLLPHINAGVMGLRDIQALRKVRCPLPKAQWACSMRMDGALTAHAC